jgi:hypothetical protein
VKIVCVKRPSAIGLPNSRTPKVLAPCWPWLRSNGESWRKEQPTGKNLIGPGCRKQYGRTSAQAEPGKGPETHQKSDFDSAGQRQRFADTGPFERLEQALQHSGIAMETLARINVFDLNNPGAPPARGVDSMHAEPAIANEPRHH